MRETKADLQALERLLDSSRARASEHLRAIINERRMLSAADVVGLLSGMKVISLATVTACGEPRISATPACSRSAELLCEPNELTLAR